jgi:hypothetical protein
MISFIYMAATAVLYTFFHYVYISNPGAHEFAALPS